MSHLALDKILRNDDDEGAVLTEIAVAFYNLRMGRKERIFARKMRRLMNG